MKEDHPVKNIIIAMLLLFLAAPLIAQEPPDNGPRIATMIWPNIYDRDGRTMGQLVSFDQTGAGYMLFDLPDKDAVVSLKIKRQKGAGGIQWAKGPVFYGGANCTGDVFSQPADVLSNLAGVVVEGDSLYLGSADAEPQFIRYLSTYDDDGCRQINGFTNAVQLEFYMKLEERFPQPFSVENIRSRARAVSHR